MRLITKSQDDGAPVSQRNPEGIERVSPSTRSALVVPRCVLEAQYRMICCSVSRESAAQQSRSNGVAPMLTPCSIRNKSGDGCEG